MLSVVSRWEADRFLRGIKDEKCFVIGRTEGLVIVDRPEYMTEMESRIKLNLLKFSDIEKIVLDYLISLEKKCKNIEDTAALRNIRYRLLSDLENLRLASGFFR